MVLFRSPTSKMTFLAAINLTLLALISTCWAQGNSDAKPVIQVIYTSTDPVLIEAISSFKHGSDVQFDFQWIDQSELKQRLLQQKEDEDMPEIVVASEDLLGLHSEIQLSAIPDKQFNDYVNSSKALYLSAVSENERLYGLPVTKGNHLVLFYHWKYVQTVAGSWHELLGQRYSIAQDVELITWSPLDMYWLVPFMSAYGELPVQGNEISFDVDGVAKSLRFVWDLIDKKVIDINCDYTCTVEKFMKGDVAYHINGVWEYERLKKQLGDDLGIAPLPTIEGKQMNPYYANTYLMFPRDSLHGPYSEIINQYIEYTKTARFNKILLKSMSSFSLTENKSGQFPHETEDHKLIRYTLRSAIPMPHHKKMFLVWEAMLNGFVRYGGGSLEDYQAASYMQNYVDNHN